MCVDCKCFLAILFFFIFREIENPDHFIFIFTVKNSSQLISFDICKLFVPKISEKYESWPLTFEFLIKIRCFKLVKGWLVLEECKVGVTFPSLFCASRNFSFANTERYYMHDSILFLQMVNDWVIFGVLLELFARKNRWYISPYIDFLCKRVFAFKLSL